MSRGLSSCVGAERRARLPHALQARDYEDDDYIAGVKGGRPGDPRARAGGAAGGLVRSGSEMSLPAGDQRMNKRVKSQLASKPSDTGRMDMHGRWVWATRPGLLGMLELLACWC